MAEDSDTDGSDDINDDEISILDCHETSEPKKAKVLIVAV